MPTYGSLPPVDPAAAETLLEPPGTGEGHWVGAPCVHRHDGTTYLAVRFRNPVERGYAIRVYDVDDGLAEVRELRAADLGAVSVERPALVTTPGGALRCYLPVEHGENDWTIQRLDDVADPADLDPATARDVLVPAPGGTDAETVKDPVVVTVGGRYHLFYAGHDGESEQAHLATSVDGDDWTRSPANPILPSAGWHDHHTRVSCVAPMRDCPAWHVFYDGSGRADHGRTWNLRTGTAAATDLETVVDTSPDEPWLEARPGGGAGESSQGDDDPAATRFVTCRYMDVQVRENGWDVYLEVARPDGGFELRRATAPL